MSNQTESNQLSFSNVEEFFSVFQKDPKEDPFRMFLSTLETPSGVITIKGTLSDMEKKKVHSTLFSRLVRQSGEHAGKDRFSPALPDWAFIGSVYAVQKTGQYVIRLAPPPYYKKC